MSKFYWAKIGDNGPEPVVVVGKKGERLAYTAKCPDPFFVDERNSPIVLGSRIEVPYEELTEAQQQREDKLARRRQLAYRARHPQHSYAGFGRKSA